MVKEIIVYTHYGILLIDKKKHKWYMEQLEWLHRELSLVRKKILNGYETYISIYITFWNDNILEMQNRLVVARS